MANTKINFVLFSIGIMAGFACCVIAEMLWAKRRCDRERDRCAIITRLAKLVSEIDQHNATLASYPNISEYLNRSYLMFERVLYDTTKKYHSMVIRPLYRVSNPSFDVNKFIEEMCTLGEEDPIFTLASQLSDIYGYYWRHEHPYLYYRDTIKKILLMQIFRFFIFFRRISASDSNKVMEYQEQVQKGNWQIA